MIPKGYKIRPLTLGLGLLFIASTVAYSWPEGLLNQHERPRISQVQQWRTHIPDEQGIPDANFQWQQYWENVLLQEAPKLIATLERYYPNAQFVFMGRDSQLIGEIIESFYLTLGRRGRVKYLGGSKPSYRDEDGKEHWQHDPDMLIKFLAGAGVSLRSITASQHPVIFIDTVSSGNGRQGRALLHALYAAHAQDGGRVSDLMRKVNMLGLVVSTFRSQYNPVEDIKQLYYEMSHEYQAGGVTYYEAHRFPMFQANQKFNEIGYTHHTGEWHGSYGPLQQRGNEVTAPPGAMAHINYRKSILWIQKRVIALTSTPDFRESVRAAAQAMGFEFPFDGRALVIDDEDQTEEDSNPSNTGIAQTIAKFDQLQQSDMQVLAIIAQQFQTLTQTLGESPKVDDGITVGAQHLINMAQNLAPHYNTNLVGIGLLEAAVTAHPRKIIRRRDLKFILEKALIYAAPSTRLIQAIINLTKQSEGFKNKRVSDSNWVKHPIAKKRLSSIDQYLRELGSNQCRRTFGGTYP